ncbi:MAG: hypothetical protein JNK48_11210 [Bryobacterales bacterium]|nr:hypothetical protein [Bryobacterales bacterium]
MMTRRQLLHSAPAAGAALALRGADAIAVGSRRELFVDRFLIERLTGAAMRLQPPRREEPALVLDRPWEGRFSNYATVIRDGNEYRMYYRGLPEAGKDLSSYECTCLALSKDGKQFTRPDLGIHEYQGSRKNNLILANEPPYSSNFSPFIDTRPGVAADQRYKALAGTQKGGLVAFQSADGIRWKKMRQEGVFLKGVFDSQNLAFWSETEQKYVMYFRTFKRFNGRGVRWISRTTSDDFLYWSEPVDMTFGGAPPEHMYVNQTHPYYRAPHIYIALAARFMPGRQVMSDEEARALGVNAGYYKDCADAVLLTSRGGTAYDRTFPEAFLRPGLGVENWVSRNNYPALNTVETGPAEISFYTLSNYGQPGTHLRRYSLPMDRFASISAGYGGGEALTRPLTFSGAQLFLNFSTSAPGGIRTEILDADAAPVAGFAIEDSVELIGDQIERAVRWKQGSDLSRLAGKPVRLRFVMKDADIFALRFG